MLTDAIRPLTPANYTVVTAAHVTLLINGVLLRPTAEHRGHPAWRDSSDGHVLTTSALDELMDGEVQVSYLAPLTGDLFDVATDAWIRPATVEELADSLEASAFDGGVGVIAVDGVNCYAM